MILREDAPGEIVMWFTVRDFDDASTSDTERYGALFRGLLERGVYVAPSQFECMFVSLAHGNDEIDRTIRAFGAAAAGAAAISGASAPATSMSPAPARTGSDACPSSVVGLAVSLSRE